MPLYAVISKVIFAFLVVLLTHIFISSHSQANDAIQQTNSLLAFEGRWRIDEKGFQFCLGWPE